MQLSPKYNPTNKPWIMSNNKPTQITITGLIFFLGTKHRRDGKIEQSQNNGTEYSTHYLTLECGAIEFEESELFETKEALLATL